ncbi:MAG: TetR/AcrR family transcriptional regulator [Chloroflexota bacterium]
MSDNRAKIMQIALRMFAAQGYEAVGVQDIVEAAGVTKPTLYHYFHSKRGLLEAIVEERSAPLLTHIAQVTTYEGNVTQSITDTIKAFFQFAEQQPTFYRMILALWFAPPSSECYPIILTVLRPLLQNIETMFLEASQDHGNMRGRHRRYAVTLKGVIDTYIGLSFQDHIRLDDEELVYRLAHEFMHGIFS